MKQTPMQAAINTFLEHAKKYEIYAICMTLDLICSAKEFHTLRSCSGIYETKIITECLREHAAVINNTPYACHVVALLSMRNCGYDAILIAKMKMLCSQASEKLESQINGVSHMLCYLYRLEPGNDTMDNFNVAFAANMTPDSTSKLAGALRFVHSCLADCVNKTIE